MLEIFFTLAGTVFGFALGLLPGFHINNVFALLASAVFSPEFACFAAAASMSFVFASFFPTVLLGVPSEDTALGVLPAHRLAGRGQAYTALLLFVYGGLFAVLACVVLLAFFAVFTQPLYSLARPCFPFLLLAIVLFLALKGVRCLLIVLLSSALGFLTFDYDLLFPLLSGFFAASTLIASLFSKPAKVSQKTLFKTGASKFSLCLAGAAACFFSSFFSLLPGVSSAVSASAARIVARMREHEFLFALGATSTAYMVFSFYTFSLVGITRSGSAAFVSNLGQADFLFYAGSVLAGGGLAALFCLKFARPAVAAYSKISKRLLESIALVFLFASNFLLGGFYGLLVFLAAASIGLLASTLRVPKSVCMAALVTPTAAVLLT